MITAVDRILYKRWIPSNWASTVTAGMTYNFIAALDNETAVGLKQDLRIPRCFTPDWAKIRYRLTDHTASKAELVDWGTAHWHETTWVKVYVVRMVWDMGFNVIHADSDITWFKDPMHFFKKHLDAGPAPPHMLLSLDRMDTQNEPGEEDVERDATPYLSINTGIYLLKHWPHDREFMEEWLRWYSPAVLNDQHALNHVIRGKSLTGERGHPFPIWGNGTRMIWAAFNQTFACAFLPASQFANSYTYIKGRLHSMLNQTLYSVHWVWSGAAYNKQQNMRDAGVYLDPPEYYTLAPNNSLLPSQRFSGLTMQRGSHLAAAGALPGGAAAPQGPAPIMLLSMDIKRPQAPPGFNDLLEGDIETMIRFHVNAVNVQLQQLYYGFMAALVLNRTLVVPKTNCFCSRNWFKLYACRINGERSTQFPFTCTMHDILRAKFIINGIRLPYPWTATMSVVHVREHSFLANPRTPQEIKASRLNLTVAPPEAAPPAPTGPIKSQGSLAVPAGLAVEDLVQWLQPAIAETRVVHLTDATALFGVGFANRAAHMQFDNALRTYATFWCCRAPEEAVRWNVTDRERFGILPPSRQNMLLN